MAQGSICRDEAGFDAADEGRPQDCDGCAHRRCALWLARRLARIPLVHRVVAVFAGGALGLSSGNVHLIEVGVRDGQIPQQRRARVGGYESAGLRSKDGVEP